MKQNILKKESSIKKIIKKVTKQGSLSNATQSEEINYDSKLAVSTPITTGRNGLTREAKSEVNLG